jgi:signal transduction histidine kinase
MFRVVQEALLNIHHHAHSMTATIRLRVRGEHLTVEIEDRGRGIASAAHGVGIAGMRERLQQLGGILEITSSDRGTTVRAEIPVPRDTV